MSVPSHFQIFKDKGGDYRWRLRAAGNGKIIADSAEGYRNRADCIAGMNLVAQVSSKTTHIWDVDAQKYVDK